MLFKGYNAVKTFYNASSQSGGELYLTAEQLGAIQSDIQDEIHQDRKQLPRRVKLTCPVRPQFAGGCRWRLPCSKPG